MPSREEIVERELGVRLPEDYKSFLKAHGIYEYPGGEVYGITDGMVDLDQIPCVIGATRKAKALYNLPKGYVVINHSGFEDEMVCLDTETGQIYMVGQGTREKIAGSFDEWFSREVLDRALLD
jgi:hypothetical protein